MFGSPEVIPEMPPGLKPLFPSQRPSFSPPHRFFMAMDNAIRPASVRPPFLASNGLRGHCFGRSPPKELKLEPEPRPQPSPP